MINTNQTDLIELFSESIHSDWWEEKKKQGFHSPKECPTLRDGDTYHKFTRYCDKCHTDMYPYPELPENIKEYDRVTAISQIKSMKLLRGRGVDLNQLVDEWFF